MSVFSNDLVLNYILPTDNIIIVSFPFTFHIVKFIFKVCILPKTYKYDPPFIISCNFCLFVKLFHHLIYLIKNQTQYKMCLGFFLYLWNSCIVNILSVFTKILFQCYLFPQISIMYFHNLNLFSSSKRRKKMERQKLWLNSKQRWESTDVSLFLLMIDYTVFKYYNYFSRNSDNWPFEGNVLRNEKSYDFTSIQST